MVKGETQVELATDAAAALATTIGNLKATKCDVARAFAVTLRECGARCDWTDVNVRIRERWDETALRRIKDVAWRMYERIS